MALISTETNCASNQPSDGNGAVKTETDQRPEGENERELGEENIPMATVMLLFLNTFISGFD